MLKFYAGCKSLRKLVSELQSRIVICGHIHESLGTAYIGETLVVNLQHGETWNGGENRMQHSGNTKSNTATVKNNEACFYDESSLNFSLSLPA